MYALGPLLLIGVLFFGGQLLAAPTDYLITVMERVIAGIAHARV